MRFPRYALLLAALLFPAISFAGDYGFQQPFIDISGINQIDGVNVNPNIPAPGNFTTLTAQTVVFSSTVTTQSVPFSTAISGNPLMQMTVQRIPVASINAAGGYAVLASVAGRTIYPGNVIVTAQGGNVSGSTGVKVLCGSGNVLASIATAQLTSAVGVSAFSASVTPGNAFTGCATGDGVFISNVGANLATATALFVNLPYTVQ